MSIAVPPFVQRSFNLALFFPDAHCYNDELRQLSDLIICYALQFSVHFKGQSPRTNQT